jgi:hypothetical protein
VSNNRSHGVTGPAPAKTEIAKPSARPEPPASSVAYFSGLMRRDPVRNPPAQREESTERRPFAKQDDDQKSTRFDLYADSAGDDSDGNPFDSDTPILGSLQGDGRGFPADFGVTAPDQTGAAGAPMPQNETLERLTQGLVTAIQMSRKTVANKWAVRMMLEPSFLKDTALELKRDGGQLKVRIVTSSLDSYRAMAPHLAELRDRLETRCGGFAEVDIRLVSGPVGGETAV